MANSPFNPTIVVSLMIAMLLVSCTGQQHEQHIQQLEELERMNRADSLMTNDTLALELVDFFDSHGTPNERMRAHYILGRTYADLGEAPAALNAYLDAVECADTTSDDCDWYKLSRVYGQMSTVYYNQNLMEECGRCIEHAIKYAWMSNDTMQALNAEGHLISVFYQMKQYKKVIKRFEKVFSNIKQVYGIKEASKYAVQPIASLIEEGRLEEARKYVDLLVDSSGYFDAQGNVLKGREGSFYYIGRYYLAVGQLDSAENCFRKELLTGLDVQNQCMASRGLSLVFEQMSQADSAAKYAMYSYEMVDSLYSQKTTAEVERASALYNYSRHLDIANQEHNRAEREEAVKQRLYLLLILLVGSFLGLFYLINKRRRRAAERYGQKVRELSEALRNLDSLKEQKALFESLANEELKNKSEELSIIAEQNEKLAQQITEANNALAQMRKDVLKNPSDIVLTKGEIDFKLGESSVYQNLMLKVASCQVLDKKEWKEIESLVKRTLPGFYNLITFKQSSLRQEGRRLCILLRLHVGLKEASVLMDVSQPKVSKLSRKILQQVFKEDGSGKELILRLEDIV